MKKIPLILILCTLVVFAANAQKKATIKFDQTEYDLGKMKEVDGNKTCMFKFTNVGDDSLKILLVKPACNCIVSDWTKSPIPPKGKGFISATYDPRNRPGLFTKGIDVTTNDPDQPRITLVIKGEVEPRPRTIADDYPNAVGHLRMNTGQINLQNVPNTDTRTDTLKLYNEWNQAMTFDFSQVPVYIKCKMTPEILKPGQKGYMLVSYNAKIRNDFGALYDRFMIVTNDSLDPQKPMLISVNIIEDFSKYTPEQMANAPKISFEMPTYDFGTVKEGDAVNYDFVFTNLGKDTLIIRKVKGG